jgi:hypothetical protein
MLKKRLHPQKSFPTIEQTLELSPRQAAMARLGSFQLHPQPGQEREVFRGRHRLHSRSTITQLRPEPLHSVEFLKENKQIFATELRLPKGSPQGGTQAIEGEVRVGTHAPQLTQQVFTCPDYQREICAVGGRRSREARIMRTASRSRRRRHSSCSTPGGQDWA